MKNLFLIFFFGIVQNSFGQFMQEPFLNEEQIPTVYEKNTEYAEERSFKEDLKTKYSNKEFIYIDDKEPEENNSQVSPFQKSLVKAFLFFMRNIFPFLLGLIIIYMVLKTFLGTEIGFFSFKKQSKKAVKKIFFEDDDMTETDLENLLQKAISQKQYRLAIRYYYVSSLKLLSNKKVIDFHKDKTNTEYLLEIKDAAIKTQFSYLSYIYCYVWYGEFPIDEQHFNSAQKKYQSFKTSLK